MKTEISDLKYDTIDIEQVYLAFEQVNSNLTVNKKLMNRSRSGAYVSQPAKPAGNNAVISNNKIMRLFQKNNEFDKFKDMDVVNNTTNGNVEKKLVRTYKMDPVNYWSGPHFLFYIKMPKVS